MEQKLWVMMIKGCGVSVWSEENVLGLVVERGTEHYRESKIWIHVQTFCPSAFYHLSSLCPEVQMGSWRVSCELQWVREV